MTSLLKFSEDLELSSKTRGSRSLDYLKGTLEIDKNKARGSTHKAIFNRDERDKDFFKSYDEDSAKYKKVI